MHYHIRGKKTFPVTGNGLLSFNVKGRSNINKELKQVSLILTSLARYFHDS